MIAPLFTSYRDLWLHIMKGKEVLSKLNLRISNNVMFLGWEDDSIRKMYNYSTKLYVIIYTLEDLIYDNPLFCYTDVLNDNLDTNLEIGSSVYNKWINRFSDLYACLKVTIDRAERQFRTENSIEQLDVICQGTTIDQTSDYDPHRGDYDLTDYNDDYYK